MATYKRRRYLLMSADPVHVGTGGYRLGRVDLSIVREPGTRVPKIPGTSFSGAIRSYAASQYESVQCAGQKNHCAEATCPICYTFGCAPETNAAGTKTIAHSGVANLFDAQVLLFPVHSMAGPVWVTTVERLKEAGFSLRNVLPNEQPSDDQPSDGLPEELPPDDQPSEGLPEELPRGDLPEIPLGSGLYTWHRDDALNLGWLMVEPGSQVSIEAPEEWQDAERWQAIRDHVVLVREALFSQVVNSNLEVRTSVSIDPERGAAEEGALFTYEALPRATFLVSEVVLDDYRDGQNSSPFPVKETAKKNALPGAAWNDPLDVVDAGLRLVEWLGVGGMGTRGFGRLAVVGRPVEEVWK